MSNDKKYQERIIATPSFILDFQQIMPKRYNHVDVILSCLFDTICHTDRIHHSLTHKKVSDRVAFYPKKIKV